MSTSRRPKETVRIGGSSNDVRPQVRPRPTRFDTARGISVLSRRERNRLAQYYTRVCGQHDPARPAGTVAFHTKWNRQTSPAIDQHIQVRSIQLPNNFGITLRTKVVAPAFNTAVASSQFANLGPDHIGIRKDVIKIEWTVRSRFSHV